MRGVDRVQQRHAPFAFAFGVIKKYGDDRGAYLAALITYYGLLALFPLLLVFVTILGFVLAGDPALRADLLRSSVADFPIIGTQLRRNVGALGGNGIGLAIGLAVMVWGSLGVANAAQHAMAEVWNVPGRIRPGFLPRTARAISVLGVLALAVLASPVITSAATLVPRSAVLGALALGGTLLLNVLLYLVAFRVLSPKSIPTRDLITGAIVGGVAWTALQSLGAWLVARQLHHTSELYGFFAIVLGLMFWLFLAAQLTVYAAEINVVHARHLWPRSIVQPPLTPADEHVLRDLATAEERRPEQRVDVRFDHPATSTNDKSD